MHLFPMIEVNFVRGYRFAITRSWDSNCTEGGSLPRRFHQLGGQLGGRDRDQKNVPVFIEHHHDAGSQAFHFVERIINFARFCDFSRVVIASDGFDFTKSRRLLLCPHFCQTFPSVRFDDPLGIGIVLLFS